MNYQSVMFGEGIPMLTPALASTVECCSTTRLKRRHKVFANGRVEHFVSVKSKIKEGNAAITKYI